jgi:crotonobetainyl-CoA:carnitine CoA-transferase CaiB-like acyl-CoA transferase
VFGEPQARHLGLELRLQHPSEGEVVTVAPPARFSATPWAGLQAPPVLGEDTDAVLAELGLPGAPRRPGGPSTATASDHG